MGLRRMLLVAVVLIGGVFVPTRDAFACSCAEPPSDRVAVRRTDAVFSGRVVDSARPMFSEGRHLDAYAVEVETAYKGTVYEKQWVYTAPQEGGCGYDMDLFKRYLVFAHGEGPRELSISICTNTHPLGGAADVDLEAAGIVLPGRSRSTPPDVFFALLTVVAGMVAYAKGKKRRPT